MVIIFFPKSFYAILFFKSLAVPETSEPAIFAFSDTAAPAIYAFSPIAFALPDSKRLLAFSEMTLPA